MADIDIARVDMAVGGAKGQPIDRHGGQFHEVGWLLAVVAPAVATVLGLWLREDLIYSTNVVDYILAIVLVALVAILAACTGARQTTPPSATAAASSAGPRSERRRSPLRRSISAFSAASAAARRSFAARPAPPGPRCLRPSIPSPRSA